MPQQKNYRQVHGGVLHIAIPKRYSMKNPESGKISGSMNLSLPMIRPKEGSTKQNWQLTSFFSLNVRISKAL